MPVHEAQRVFKISVAIKVSVPAELVLRDNGVVERYDFRLGYIDPITSTS